MWNKWCKDAALGLIESGGDALLCSVVDEMRLYIITSLSPWPSFIYEAHTQGRMSQSIERLLNALAHTCQRHAAIVVVLLLLLQKTNHVMQCLHIAETKRPSSEKGCVYVILRMSILLAYACTVLP